MSAGAGVGAGVGVGVGAVGVGVSPGSSIADLAPREGINGLCNEEESRLDGVRSFILSTFACLLHTHVHTHIHTHTHRSAHTFTHAHTVIFYLITECLIHLLHQNV